MKNKIRLAIFVLVNSIFPAAVNAEIYTWGTNNGHGIIPTSISTSNIVQIDGCWAHSVALLSGGSVVAWGVSSDGITSVPFGLSNVQAISAGFAWTLALKGDGSLVAWGANDSGQISGLPPGNNFIRIATGNMHGAALTSSGAIVLWGRNDFGQATLPPGLSGVISIVAGGHNTAALLANGSVVQWGANSDGRANVPSGLTNVVSIAAGSEFMLALKEDGSVVSWGGGSSTVHISMPTFPDRVEAIFATKTSAFALLRNGALLGWGDNSAGQLNIPSLPSGMEWQSVSGGWSQIYGTAVALPVLSIETAIRISFTSKAGDTYTIEKSTDLINWTPEIENISGNGEDLEYFFSFKHLELSIALRNKKRAEPPVAA